uniref:T6SS Phospholipase effector Tle1-like catalytic domain-containing protein n=1 Tax=Moniliophthora roreri TaxID=221103 RepID=A0A0W0F0R5_MONRR
MTSNKTLLVFCDGTGMDGTLAPPRSSNNLGDVQGGGGGSSTQYATNVLRLARSVKSVDDQGKRQIVFYQSGVGSEATFKGDPVTGTTMLQALGTAVASKIRDAYVFIAQNFEVGDEICIFGFSRGAYTARKLSGLIDAIGLLTRQNLGYFFGIWRQLIDKETPSIPSDTRRTNIKCVGVWDTVGSVYKEIDALNITDTSLPKTVKVALHAVSLQENRKKFLPTLWDIPSGGLQPGQVLKQVWFPGAHSDVGGGYKRHDLADISVYWMAGEVSSLIALDLDFLRLYEQANPDAWGTSQPHNAYMELPLPERLVIGHETRLESKQITQTSVFHESLKYSPQSLTTKDYMVTMTILQNQFGSGFAPQYPPLNDFEKYCKDNWGKKLGAAPPHEVESPEVVVPPAIQWVQGQRRLVPPNAIQGGKQSDGTLLYVARAPYQDGLHPGKTNDQIMSISYSGKEITITSGFEVLVGNQSAVTWVQCSGAFSLSQLGDAMPVVGGYDADGKTFYVAQVDLKLAQVDLSVIQITLGAEGVHCGKVKEGGTASVPFNGQEVVSGTYSVLAFAPNV